MLSLFLRTLVLYFSLFFFMRMTGKRQIGQLQLSELVTAFLLSELASGPLTDLQMPLLHALLPIALLVSLEVLLSFFVTKSVKMKRLFDGTPALLISKGKLDQTALGQARISAEELLGQMRLKGFGDLSQINYAILEHNGQISFLPFAKDQPPSAKAQSISVKDPGYTHALIVDGAVSQTALSLAGKDQSWLLSRLAGQKISLEDVFLCTLNDDGTFHIIPKEKEG